LTISAFSRLSVFLSLPARAFSMIAHNARALAAPTNKIVVIYAALLTWVLTIVEQDGIVRLPELPQKITEVAVVEQAWSTSRGLGTRG
jgi:hypothetical protein